MMATRLKQFGLLLFSMLICGVAFFQMFERTTGGFPQNYLWMLAFVGALFLTSWGLPLRFQPYANQAIMCCVMVLTGTGIMMIARIDQDSNTSVAFKQLLWLSIALVLANLLVIFMKDYRVLRRFSYVSMVIGLVLLLSPMLPVIGSEQYGARIWVKIPGLGSFQPSEFAKLFLAFFFASYLYDHRDQLAVGGKKVLGLQLPRIKDLGPIIVVWIVSMGVLVVQHDLGTSLMFFAMFVSMLYVATGRTSWIVIGFIAFAVGAFAAANIFSHVGARVDAWLHPFDSAQYNKEYGGSYQLVTGIFGLASGGLMGTGLGQGHPSAHSDRQLRLHLRGTWRRAGPHRSDGHSDALSAHHRRRDDHCDENQGWVRQASRIGPRVHHGLPGVHRGGRHHVSHPAYGFDSSVHGRRRILTHSELHVGSTPSGDFQLGEQTRIRYR